MANLVLHPTYGLYERKDKGFCTSMQVSEWFDRRHDNVIRDIKELDCSAEFMLLNFEELRRQVDLGDGRFRKYPYYLINKNGFMFLVLGYRGKKAAVIREFWIKRFDDMENFIKNYILSRDEYLPFTRAIEFVHDEPKSYHYSNEYDMINRLVLGMSAKQFKTAHGLGNVPSIRPYLSHQQIKAIRALQNEDIPMLYQKFSFQERKSALTAFHSNLAIGGQRSRTNCFSALTTYFRCWHLP